MTRSERKLTVKVAVAAVFATSLFAIAVPSGAAVPRPKLDFLTGSSDPSAVTTLVYSVSGAPAAALSAIDVHTPPGMLFAHADSVAGVTASPVEPRPHDGEVVGHHADVGDNADLPGGCDGEEDSVWSSYVWDEPFQRPALPNQVAELWNPSFYVHVVLSPADAIQKAPHYDLVVLDENPGPDTSKFCSNFRSSGFLEPPEGEAILVNPAVASVAKICAVSTTVLDATTNSCDHELFADDTTHPTCTITGTTGDDVLIGTLKKDVICGSDGNDTIDGGGGPDIIIGGDGDDHLIGGAAADYVLGGDGSDVISGGPAGDYVDAGIGDDTINGDLGNNTLSGGSGDDNLTNGTGTQIQVGGDGSDTCGVDSTTKKPGLLDGCES